jgi:Tol biopolymer transport system component
MSGKWTVSLLLVSVMLLMPLAMAPPNHPCEPWPECKGGGGGGPEGEANPEIAFSAGENLGRLRVMDADGDNAQTITREGGIKRHMSWSPDGGSLAFSMNGGIWVIDVRLVDGDPVGENLTIVEGGMRSAWSPSGEIAFVSGAGEIKVINRDGSGSGMLYAPPAGFDVGDLAWNSDGSLLAFYERNNTSPYISVIHILDRNTLTITETLNDPGVLLTSFRGISWARTTDTLAVVSSIWIYTVTWTPGGSGTFELLTEGAFPTWSPTDSDLAFQKKEKTQFNIKSIDMSSGEIMKLTRDGWYPDWKR